MSNIQIIDNTQPPMNNASIQLEAKQNLTEQILTLTSGFEFFHTPNDEAYVTVPVDQHFENYQIDSKEFRRYLSYQYYQATGHGLKASAFNELLPTLEAKTQHQGSKQKVYIRTAFVNNTVYLDICDNERNCVEIKPTGWKIITNPPVKFRRTKYMTSLPIPQDSGDVRKLRLYINLSQEHYHLLIAWLLSAMKGTTPLPILTIIGHQGSGKSTATKFIRSLLDPSTIPLRSSYYKTRDLMITCVNTNVVVMDNISHISDEMSDMLCGIATGTGQSHRVLHTNREEDVLQGGNPIIINGIDGLPQRADFVDRAILISPLPISETERVPESTLLAKFEADKPKIFGALCDALASALFYLPEVKLEQYPRMADFATLAVAASQELGWEDNWFMEAYSANQLELTDHTVASNPFIAMLLYYLQNNNNYYKGTMSGLLGRIKAYLESPTICTSPPDVEIETMQHTRGHGWPTSPQQAGQLITRFEPSLQRLGYTIHHSRGMTCPGIFKPS